MRDDIWDNERFEGPYARDRHRGGYGGDYARDSFRGRGPKNYRRGDDRIWEEVNERLTEDEDVNATDIEVKVESGIVTLTGRVGSRREKRRAEDVAGSVRGVIDVMNALRISPMDREVAIGKASE
jgi:osmotically-inducible protein OsmY